jgi:hypothetical protein
MGEETPRLWLSKVDFIARYYGMALANTHPDYLRRPGYWAVYDQFLRALRQRDDYWHALPREAAAWWRQRMLSAGPEQLPGARLGRLRLAGNSVEVGSPSEVYAARLDQLCPEPAGA